MIFLPKEISMRAGRRAGSFDADDGQTKLQFRIGRRPDFGRLKLLRDLTFHVQTIFVQVSSPLVVSCLQQLRPLPTADSSLHSQQLHTHYSNHELYDACPVDEGYAGTTKMKGAPAPEA